MEEENRGQWSRDESLGGWDARARGGKERIKEGPPRSPTNDAHAHTHSQRERGEWVEKGKVCVGTGNLDSTAMDKVAGSCLGT